MDHKYLTNLGQVSTKTAPPLLYYCSQKITMWATVNGFLIGKINGKQMGALAHSQIQPLEVI